MRVCDTAAENQSEAKQAWRTDHLRRSPLESKKTLILGSPTESQFSRLGISLARTIEKEKAILDNSPTEHFEHAEHAEHVAHLGDRTLTLVSMTIAILAVFAATVGSLESLETAGAVGDKTHAVLLQNKASDSWSFFQAKSLKQNLYALAAAQGGARAQEFSDIASRYANEQKEIEKGARSLEAHSEEALASSERHERRHHILTVSVTLLHVAIAVATIAIIVRGQLWPWRAAIMLGFAGAAGALYAYVT